MGVSFVAPLSSPKALTNRENQAGKNRRHGYYLVRQLAADLSEFSGL
jgi:hypothetical protein